MPLNERIEDTMKRAAEEQKAGQQAADNGEAVKTPPTDEVKKPDEEVVTTSPSELTSDQVFEFLDKNDGSYLQYLSKKEGREITSLDDLKTVEEKIVEVEKDVTLPDDVKQYWDYKNETGRDFNDFLKANKDWTSESEETVVMEHIRQQKGLEGEDLKEYFELTYKPNEDEASEREIKKAKLELKADAKTALTFLTEQNKKYSLPSEEAASQRQAEDAAKDDARVFSEGMLNAIRTSNEIEVEGVKLGVEKASDLEKRFSSVNGIMSKYQTDDGFDHKALFNTLYKGEHFETLAKAYADQVKNTYIEQELANLENKKTPVGHTGGNEGGVDEAKVKAFISQNLL